MVLKTSPKHLVFSGGARPWHRGSRCILGLNNVVKMKPCKAEGSGVEVSNRESELSAHPLSITSSDQSILVKYNILCHNPPLCWVISPKRRFNFGPEDRVYREGKKWRTCEGIEAHCQGHVFGILQHRAAVVPPYCYTHIERIHK